MRSLTNFISNLLILGGAILANLWSQSWLYWYMPDFFVIAVIWLQFVTWRINYVAFVLASLCADVYFDGFFGSHLMALTLVLYLMGSLNFATVATLRIFGSVVVGVCWLAVSQILLFVNFGVNGVLHQLWLYTFLKAVSVSCGWLLLVFFRR